MTYNHIQPFLTKHRLGELLDRAGMSRDDLAKFIETTPQVLEAIEDGKYDPPLSMAYKLAGALEVPVEDLYEDWTAKNGRIAE